jgi:hypothetical protein
MKLCLKASLLNIRYITLCNPPDLGQKCGQEDYQSSDEHCCMHKHSYFSSLVQRELKIRKLKKIRNGCRFSVMSAQKGLTKSQVYQTRTLTLAQIQTVNLLYRFEGGTDLNLISSIVFVI